MPVATSVGAIDGLLVGAVGCWIGRGEDGLQGSGDSHPRAMGKDCPLWRGTAHSHEGFSGHTETRPLWECCLGWFCILLLAATCRHSPGEMRAGRSKVEPSHKGGFLLCFSQTQHPSRAIWSPSPGALGRFKTRWPESMDFLSPLTEGIAIRWLRCWSGVSSSLEMLQVRKRGLAGLSSMLPSGAGQGSGEVSLCAWVSCRAL